MHICTLLKRFDNEVTIVKCPETNKGEKGRYFVNGWGQIDSKRIPDCLKESHIADRDEINLYAERWYELEKENAPLRAVISGQIISVREDFYDFQIRDEFPFKSVRQSVLIGDIFTKNIGVYDFWYMLRIQKMIDNGEIIVEQSAECDNDRIISTREDINRCF